MMSHRVCHVYVISTPVVFPAYSVLFVPLYTCTKEGSLSSISCVSTMGPVVGTANAYCPKFISVGSLANAACHYITV